MNETTAERPVAYHPLKTWPVHFRAVWDGTKTAELRKDDRAFRVGHLVCLKEYDPDKDTYSGRSVEARITHVVAGGFGLKDGYVMLSMKLINRRGPTSAFKDS